MKRMPPGSNEGVRAGAGLVSVVVPTLDEAANLDRLLHSLGGEGGPHEIIVTDGGSRDGTVDVARRRGARVVSGGRGRGAQLSLGAKAAQGDILWFLHADTRLSSSALPALRLALLDPGIVGGNFRVVFDGESDFARWLTDFYAWFRRFGLYYGDSGIFARRAAYEAIGGIRSMALMEDYEFSRRLNRAGRTICIGDPALIASSRRFEGRSSSRIFAGWIAIHTLYHLGAPPGILARLYRSTIHASGRRR